MATTLPKITLQKQKRPLTRCGVSGRSENKNLENEAYGFVICKERWPLTNAQQQQAITFHVEMVITEAMSEMREYTKFGFATMSFSPHYYRLSFFGGAAKGRSFAELILRAIPGFFGPLRMTANGSG